MKLTEFVEPNAIVCGLEGTTKDDAIREIVQGLVSSTKIKEDDYDGVVKAIQKREQLGSTGIGNGVAVPHTKHPSVKELTGTVAVSGDGVEFNALDGEPVFIMFLLVSPPDKPGEHLRALETISKHLKDDRFCRFMKQCKSQQEMWDLLQEADEGLESH